MSHLSKLNFGVRLMATTIGLIALFSWSFSGHSPSLDNMRIEVWTIVAPILAYLLYFQLKE